MIRVGVIGIGNMGSTHCKRLVEGKVKNAKLSAICDVREDRLSSLREKVNLRGVEEFISPDDFFSFKSMDAVIIATPHYLHPVFAVKALNSDFHVLVEKPIGVYSKQARELISVASMKRDKVFGIMLNQRTNPYYIKAKELANNGTIGKIRRICFVITDWFRTQSYYDSAEWRATWKGEGGGIVINQCPHNLDLITWMFGLPKKVHAFCKNGKYHTIETEDEITVYLEFDNDMTGVLIASTGEAPGTNVIEICGDKGKLLLDGPQSLKLYRAETDTISHIQKEFGPWKKPNCYEETIFVNSSAENPRGGQHLEIINNWISAILGDKTSFIDGSEGLNSLLLANAIYLSTWLEETISIPFDEDQYHILLKEKADNSVFSKDVREREITIGEQPYL